jgi:hypothetical protein
MRGLVIALFFVTCTPSISLAWGDLGHKIVCDLAFKLALPETRAEIRRLIQKDEQFDFFRDACIWPDHPRKRGPEHFINLARSATKLTSSACPLAAKCTLTAIESDMDVLSSTASDDKKLDALKFLGHWVGDLHQPLHVSFEDDRGGNNVPVSGECSTNMHSTWDTCLVIKAVGASPTVAANDLLSAITPAQKELWTQATDPRDWANESFAITRAPATKYCVQQAGSCNLPSGEVDIDVAYVTNARAIVREQLSKAAVRLAKILDAALGN